MVYQAADWLIVQVISQLGINKLSLFYSILSVSPVINIIELNIRIL